MEGQASLEVEQKQLWKDDNQADDNQDEASSFPLSASEPALTLQENELNNVGEETPETVATVEEATSPTLENTALGPGLDSASSAVTIPVRQPTMLEEPQVLDLSLKRRSPRGGRLPHEAFMSQLVMMPGLQPTMLEEPEVLDLSLKRQPPKGRLPHEASMPQPAGGSQEKKGRLQGSSLEGVEEEKENGYDGDGTQKENQGDQRRDLLHQHLKAVISEDKMSTVTNKRLNILQSSGFAPNISLRKSSAKCRKSHTDGKPCQPLQCGESSAWSPKNISLHTERADMSLKPETCFRVGSATEASQPLISEGEPNKSVESARRFKRTFEPEIHQSTHKVEKVYECDECGKGFKNVSSLRKHQNIHTREKTYTCQECGKFFGDASNFRVHLQIYTGEKRYRCEECGKTFSQFCHLLRHELIHSGEKTFVCKVCGKTFSRHDSLVVHERIHSGGKPLLCQHCGKCFSDPSSFRKHEQNHTKKIGGHSADTDSLVVHERIHSGQKSHTCMEYGKCFCHPSSLKCHQHSHSRKKPYHREEFGKTFSQSNDLKDHQRIHTAGKPFQCNECGKTFSRCCNLVAHQQGHSRKDS